MFFLHFFWTFLLFSSSSVVGGPVSWNHRQDAGASLSSILRLRSWDSSTNDESSQPQTGWLKARQAGNVGSGDSQGSSSGHSNTQHGTEIPGSAGNREDTTTQSAGSRGTNAEATTPRGTITPNNPGNQRGNTQHTPNNVPANANSNNIANTNSRPSSNSQGNTAQGALIDDDTPSDTPTTNDEDGTSEDGTGEDGTSTFSSNQDQSMSDQDRGSSSHSSPSDSNSANSPKTLSNGGGGLKGGGETNNNPQAASNSTKTPKKPTSEGDELEEVDGSTGKSPTASDSTETPQKPGSSDNEAEGDDGSTSSTRAGTESNDDVDPGDSKSSSQLQDAPAYNLKNLTCEDILGQTSTEMWKLTDGSRAVQSFVDMFNQDLLYCYDCFGMKKEECKSKSGACQNGIQKSSIPDNGDKPSWSIAAALFAQLNGAKTFTCQIQDSDGCMKAPECQQCNDNDGPSASVIVSSLSNAYNSFHNTYEAIREAGEEGGLQMNKFSDVFAPVPDKEDEIIELIVITTLLGGLVGFVPYVGALGAIGAGIGAGIGMEKFFSHLPSAPDTSSSLGTILEAMKQAVENMSNTLFAQGNFTATSSDGKSEVKLTLQGMMEKDGGTLVNPDGDKSKAYAEQRSNFKRVLYQQLAVVTWQNLQVDDTGHVPFIALRPGKCPPTDPHAKQSSTEKDPGKNTMKSFESIDSHIDFEDNCYYLLDGKMTDVWSVSGHSISCGGAALPGGTKKELDENSQFFEELALEDFIIPSVLGWQNHSKQNGYESASANGNLIKKARDPGVVNLPVCDYLANYEHPGIGCPDFSAHYVDEKACKTIPKSEGKNEPGQYTQGKCRAHVEQWKKSSNSGSNANQLDVYQISVDVYDDSNRGIGSATKQKADKPLEVANANLPFNLIVVPGGGDKDPMRFWYADQYWESDNDKCKVGDYTGGSHYDGHSRQMDCSFDCPLPMPDDEPPKSATIDHPLPNPAVSAYAGPTSYMNTYSKPTPAGPSPAEQTPDYASGTCQMHVTQYQRNEGASNPTNDFYVEINIKDAKGEQAANLPKMAAPKGQKVTVKGLKKPLTVQVGDDKDYGDYSLVNFSYDGFDFNQKSKMKDTKICHYGGYEDGNRDMDCAFN
ncbi:MAG: hypothetical protein Q9223_002556, partial [Gallowayella weberi]